jgi:hypothetical protein
MAIMAALALGVLVAVACTSTSDQPTNAAPATVAPATGGTSGTGAPGSTVASVGSDGTETPSSDVAPPASDSTTTTAPKPPTTTIPRRPGQTLPRGPRGTPPTVPATTEPLGPLETAYVNAYNAECAKIWSISSNGVLTDPMTDGSRFVVADCTSTSGDNVWQGFTSEADAQRQAVGDAETAAGQLSVSGQLCGAGGRCWQAPG